MPALLVLVLVLALIAGLSAPPVVAGPGVSGPVAVSRPASAATEVAVPAVTEGGPRPVEAVEPLAGDRVRVLRPQPVDAVRSPRAPPAVIV